MAEVIFDSEECYAKRFICGCLDLSHALDMSVDKFEGDLTAEINFCTRYIPSYLSLWERIRRALAVLWDKEIWQHDFYFRSKDIDEAIEYFNEVKKRQYEHK